MAMSDIRKRTIDGLKAGDTLTVERTFTEQDMLAFAEITRDYNPVHFEKRFSDTKGFKGRICHGLLIGSMLTEIGGQIGWLASGMQFYFKKPVYFGETIRCDLTINAIDERGRAEADAVFTDQSGQTVLVADLTGIVPGEKEISVLAAMVAEGDPTNQLS
jgi:acyl dehydratase